MTPPVFSFGLFLRGTLAMLAVLSTAPLGLAADIVARVVPPNPQQETGSFAQALSSTGAVLDAKSDLVIEGKAVIDSGDSRIYECKTLTLRPGKFGGREVSPALYLKNGGFKVAQDITVPRGTIGVQGGSLEWGGTLLMKPVKGVGTDLELIAGVSKAAGNDLQIGDGGSLTMRLYDRRSNESLATQVPVLALSGSLKMHSRSKVSVTYDQAAPLTKGEYLLVRAKTIEGSMPDLTEIRGSERIDKTEMSLRKNGGDLYLIVPE